MKPRLFGTDGIRGRVGRDPITPDFMLRLGWAAGRVFANDGAGVVLIGKDTRISGYMFESALEAGLSAAGADVRLLGPVPTPAVAYLTQTHRADAGIVISASHNPHYDNGVKFFTRDGGKLSDEAEVAIELALERPLRTVPSDRIGKVQRINDAAGRYIEFCKSTLPRRTMLEGLRLVVDCAHGAAYQIAPSVFEELGAEVVSIGVSPDGININDGCGAVDPGPMRQAVLDHRADAGVALDGDGDRLIMSDARGDLLDGDDVLFVIAEDRKRRGVLGGGVVGTLMTNLGLEESLGERGIVFDRASVGDRKVLERLRSKGWLLGGESSGHIVCLDQNTTGDGIIAALQVLFAMSDRGKALADLRRGCRKYPQCIENVKVSSPAGSVIEAPEVRRAVRDAESDLGAGGRVLLRLSGTEAVVRVMVEGAAADQVSDLAGRIAVAVDQVAAMADPAANEPAGSASAVTAERHGA